MRVKLCSRCKTQKQESEFYADKRRHDGLYPQCCSCASEAKKASRRKRDEEQRKRDREYFRKWGQENPELVKLYRRRQDYKRKFGITVEEYDQMLEDQDGVCWICQGRQEKFLLAVDHDEHTGKVRGLLCMNCNTGIGHFRHDPDLLARAIDYLRRI